MFWSKIFEWAQRYCLFGSQFSLQHAKHATESTKYSYPTDYRSSFKLDTKVVGDMSDFQFLSL